MQTTEKEVVVVVPSSWPRGWLLPALAMTCIVCVVVVVANKLPITSQGGVPQRPAPTATTVLTRVVGELRAQSRLVVLQADVEAELRKSSEKRWRWIDLGTTTVWLAAPGRVQYVIDLSDIGTDALEYEPERNTLLVRLPRPYLDRDMVYVEPDPAKIAVMKQIGWARLDRCSGRQVESQVRRELRSAILAAGEHEWIRERAEKAAHEAVAKLLRPIAAKLGGETTVEVEFLPVPTEN